MMRISAMPERCNRSNVAVAGCSGKLASCRNVVVVIAELLEDPDSPWLYATRAQLGGGCHG
jgi:hypothetical protein